MWHFCCCCCLGIAPGYFNPPAARDSSAPEKTGWCLSSNLSLPVGLSIQDITRDVARSAPQWAHHHANVIYLPFRARYRAFISGLIPGRGLSSDIRCKWLETGIQLPWVAIACRCRLWVNRRNDWWWPIPRCMANDGVSTALQR